MVRNRERRWGWLLAVAIVAQIAVPAIALVQEPKPTRFGFQMYSGYGEGSITVLDADGAEIEIEPSALLPRGLRPELDWTQYVPDHFCAEIPEAVTIVVQQDGLRESRVPCD